VILRNQGGIKGYNLLYMEKNDTSIMGTMKIRDRKMVLTLSDGTKETWVARKSYELELGMRFIRFRGEYYIMK